MTSVRHIPQPAPADATDRAVLDAARAAILAVGWRRTTLTDVARRAGLSRMTLYRRWPDMQALLADLLTREWGGALTTAVTAASSAPDALSLIRDSGVALARAIRTDPLFAKIREVDPELLLPYLLDRRGRSQQQVLDHLTTSIAAGQQAGEIRSGHPATLAATLLLAVQGVVVSLPTMLGGPPGEEVTTDALEHELGALVERYLAP